MQCKGGSLQACSKVERPEFPEEGWQRRRLHGLTVSNIDQMAERGWWMEAMTTCPLARAMRFM
jgi:hypothetical protein